MRRLYVKFHEDRCKGEAVMRFKPFYLTAQSLHCDLDLWPFEPKVHRAYAWLMRGLHVKFHEDRWKGEAVMRLKPFYLTARLQTDGQTDGRTGWFQYTPPNFVAGGIKKFFFGHPGGGVSRPPPKPPKSAPAFIYIYNGIIFPSLNPAKIFQFNSWWTESTKSSAVGPNHMRSNWYIKWS